MSRILALSLHLPITVKSSSSSLTVPTTGSKDTTSTASSPAITPSYLFGHSGSGSGGSSGDTEEDYFSFLPRTAEIRREKKFVKSTQSNGGLHKALSSLGEEVWRIGYLGDTVNTDLSNLARQSYHCIPVSLSKKAYQVGYVKFCKQVLWPVLHYNVPDYPKGDGWDLEAWQGYVELNKQFLEVLCLEYQPGDVVWINDYHLMLLPRLFRERFPNAKIAFFLHVPFPSSELFRCLHVRKELLEGILGAGLIGFQTFSYARHFLQTCVRVLRAETTPTSVKLDDHIVSVGIYPIGVDVGLLDLAQQSPAVLSAISILREKYQGQHLIVGKDKLDPVKGVKEKLLAFEWFLDSHPEWIGKVVLIQIVLHSHCPDRQFQAVVDIVTRVNARYGSLSYQPILYLHQDIKFEQYLALLSMTDVFLVTSLRDGMNLSSHEFISCQQNRHGVLILSEFAGTYGTLGDALRINPWDYQEVAETIFQALTMPPPEKQAKWERMFKSVQQYSAQAWIKGFLDQVEKATNSSTNWSQFQPQLTWRSIAPTFNAAKKRLILLSFEGTLISYTRLYSSPRNQQEQDRILTLLEALTLDDRNLVYLMTRQPRGYYDQNLSHLNIGFCAENGCFLKKIGQEEWEDCVPSPALNNVAGAGWQESVQEIFDYYTERTPGASAEYNEILMSWFMGSLYFHIGVNVGEESSEWQASEMQNHINESHGSSYPIHAVDAGHKFIEVLPRTVSKVDVVQRLLQYHSEVDLVFAVGENNCWDEEVFKFLHSSSSFVSTTAATSTSPDAATSASATTAAITCTVSARSSQAQWFLPGVAGVLCHLEEVAKHQHE